MTIDQSGSVADESVVHGVLEIAAIENIDKKPEADWIHVNPRNVSSIELTNSLNLDTPGYTDLKIEFCFMAVSFESNEDFWLQYFDGNSWQTLRTWTRGIDFQNGQFNLASVEISELDYTFATNAKIRLMSDASGNGDDVYIDEIKISAR